MFFFFLLGLGTLAEASRRVVGLSDAPKNGSGGRLDGSVVLTEANAERIVQTLCRVRGIIITWARLRTSRRRVGRRKPC